MDRLLRDESGMTLVELVIVCGLLVIVMAALSNVFVSGLRASSDSSARLAAQQNVRVAFDRLEFETRCASSAKLQSSGAGVALTLPSQCPHATGSVAWCVVGGALERIPGATSCSGTAQQYVTGVTSATPFSCLSPVGTLPQLQVALSVNTTASTADSASATDTITLRNAPETTSTSTACS